VSDEAELEEELPDPAEVERYTTEERQQTVQRMRLRGMTVRAIAKLLRVNPSTVQRDMQEIRRKNQDSVSAAERDEHMAEAMARFQEVEERAWSEYHAADEGSAQRIKALDLLRVIATDRIKALKDTGFIKVDPQKVEIKHEHKLEEMWTPELMAEVAQKLLDKALTPQLAEPISEAEIIDEDEGDGTNNGDPSAPV
jgi:transposase-like protein